MSSTQPKLTPLTIRPGLYGIDHNLNKIMFSYFCVKLIKFIYLITFVILNYYF